MGGAARAKHSVRAVQALVGEPASHEILGALVTELAESLADKEGTEARLLVLGRPMSCMPGYCEVINPYCRLSNDTQSWY